jgi:hypothetical protein
MLSSFLEDIQEQRDSASDRLRHFLEDMISKTSPKALTIDPQDLEKRPHILESLWATNEDRPAMRPESFSPFLTPKARDKLFGELGRRIAMLESDLQLQDFHAVRGNVLLLARLASLLPEASYYVTRARSMLESLQMRIDTGARLQFSRLWGNCLTARDSFSSF